MSEPVAPDDPISRGSQFYKQGQYEDAVKVFDVALVADQKNEEALILRAAALRLLRRFDAAGAAIAEGLKLLPDNPRLLMERGWLHCDLKQYEDAIADFSAVLASHPTHEDALVWRAAVLRVLRRFDAAANAIADGLQHRPADLRLRNQLGQLHYDQNQYADALKVFENVLAADGANEDALVMRAASLRLLRRFDSAATAIAEGLRRFPDNIRLLQQRGWLHYDQKQYEDARKTFEVVLAADPANEVALVWRAASLRFLRRFDAAGAAIAEGLRQRPDNVSLLNERGWLHYDQKQYEDAVGIFEKVLAADPTNRSALTFRAASLRVLRRFDAAAAAIAEGLRILPDHVPLLNERAWLHYDQKQYEQAISVFDSVLALDQENEEALVWRAAAVRLLRRYDAAATAIAEGLRKRPGNVRLLNERGWLCYDTDQHEAALEAFEATLAVDAQNEDALLWRIILLRELRRFSAAAGAIDNALIVLPKNVAVMNQLAWMKYDRKLFEEAITGFEAALALAPANEDAHRGRIASLRQLNRPDSPVGTEIRDRIEAAIRQALDIVTTPDGRAQILEEQGRAAFDEDRFDAALKAFDAALAQNPNAKSAAFAKVAALRRLDRDTQALSVLRGLVSQFPDDDDVQEELGIFHLNRNEFVEAQRVFQALLKKDPKSARGLNGLGWTRHGEGRYAEAGELFERAVELFPHYPILHTGLSSALSKQRPPELTTAEEHCHRALELDANNVTALGCLGLIAFERGRLRESEDFFRSSIEADKNEGRYADLGALYVEMGRYEDAEKVLLQAIRLSKYDAQPRIELANLYLQTGDTKRAVRECRQAVALVPSSDTAARALAIALIRTEEYGEAEKVLRDAIRRQDEPKRWQLHLTLSQLLTRLGDKTSDDGLYDEAFVQVKTAIRLKPTVPDLYFHKGIIRSKMKDWRGALKEFNECKRLDENHFEADRYARLTAAQIREDIGRKSSWGGYLVAGVATLLLAVLWFRYFVPALPVTGGPTADTTSAVAATDRAELKVSADAPSVVPPAEGQGVTESTNAGAVTDTMLTIMTPLLLGMIVVGFLLPDLIKLKFAGVEAELTQPQEVISSGPKGEVSFGGSLSTIKR